MEKKQLEFNFDLPKSKFSDTGWYNFIQEQTTTYIGPNGKNFVGLDLKDIPKQVGLDGKEYPIYYQADWLNWEIK